MILRLVKLFRCCLISSDTDRQQFELSLCSYQLMTESFALLSITIPASLKIYDGIQLDYLFRGMVHTLGRGKRTVAPRRKTVGTISYLLLKEWTVGARSRPGTHCPTHGLFLTRGRPGIVVLTLQHLNGCFEIYSARAC
ncbi:hypothetical protein J6590_093878 [Homalodisca vitripennis]|nr:hypothetical protein J6590_093878 [Homalodisca vitripennis]